MSERNREMKEVFRHLWKYKFRYIGYLIVPLFFIFTSLYSEEFKKLPIFIQIASPIFFIIINIILDNSDKIKLQLQNHLLKDELFKVRKQVKHIQQIKEHEIDKIKNVLVAFIEYAEIYRHKVIKYLNLEEDYLCIAKSSEGLSNIFNKMKDKKMLPFSKVLYEWPGSIKPFERMGIYLIPIRNLKNFSPKNIRGWIKQYLIPKALNERKKFLAKLPKKLSKMADEFSYKYIAFTVRKHSIQYDFLNRKFNKEFTQTFMAMQSAKKIVKFSNDLMEVIRAKDFFLLVEWSAFAKLNTDQKKLIEGKKDKLHQILIQNDIFTLLDIAKLSKVDLGKLLRKAFGKKTTKRKTENLAEKIIDGSNHVLNVLRTAGVNI